MFTIPLPKIQPNTIAVKLSAAGERSVRKGHPWVFLDSIIKINKEGQSGDLAIVFSHNKNQVIGVGLFDPNSPIRIKMLASGGGVIINSEFFSEKINQAYSLRVPLLKTNTNSYRLIHGENDGFPGLIADVYARVLVIKLYSEIWFPYLELFINHLIKVSDCECVVLRLNRKLQRRKEYYGLIEGQVLYGDLENEVVQFIEHGVHFSANVIKGHKTGYFLDHRHNRKHVGELSDGKTVLDLFSYVGGFSIHALVNGAKKVTSVDISKQALKIALANGNLNSFPGKHITITGDAFEIMQKFISEKTTFELVIIDPPSFAKNKKDIEMAKKKYKLLAELAVKLTDKEGLLVLASCSSRVTASEFFALNESVLNAQSRTYRIALTTQHDMDHPINFEEGAYLKTGYYFFSK